MNYKQPATRSILTDTTSVVSRGTIPFAINDLLGDRNFNVITK